MKQGNNKITFPLNTVVQVRWQDAATRSLWDEIEHYEQHGPADCVSVGYLIRHTKDDILVTQTISADAQCNSAIAIPSAWVRDIKVLSPSKPRASKRPKTTKKAKKHVHSK